MLMKSTQAARLHYMANGFRMLSRGDHVLCAVTGARIALEDLRYWSVTAQEPYASAEQAAKAALTTKRF